MATSSTGASVICDPVIPGVKTALPPGRRGLAGLEPRQTVVGTMRSTRQGGTMKRYLKPRLRKLGLLRHLTRFSF